MANLYYEKSLGSSLANFVNFVKINNENIAEADDISEEEVNYLIRKIAMNMFYFPENIHVAKSDYISLIGILLKKGLVLQEYKDLKIDYEYPYNDKK